MLLTFDRGHHLVEQLAVRRDCVAAADGPFAVPVREGAASLFDNRRERRTIPNVHYGIKHDIGASRSDQHMTVGVAPGPPHFCSPLQLCARFAESVLLTTAKVRAEQQRLVQRSS